MDDAHIETLNKQATKALARFDAGLSRSRLARQVLRFLAHKKSLRSLVRVEADGLGLAGTRAAQRKEFMRLVNGWRAYRGWQIYQAKTTSVIGKDLFAKKVPILNPLTQKHLRKRYGQEHRRWPEQSYYMHPWQYASALMSLKSPAAEAIAQLSLNAASLLLLITQLEKTSKSLRRIQRVSPPIVSHLYIYLVSFLCIENWLHPCRQPGRSRPSHSSRGCRVSQSPDLDRGNLGLLSAVHRPSIFCRNLPGSSPGGSRSREYLRRP